MWLIRWVAALAAVALLSGSACTVVHSDRPMGSEPYASWPFAEWGQPTDLNGFWTLQPPGGVGPYVLVALFDTDTNRYRIERLASYDALGAETTVEIRVHRFKGRDYINSSWLFFSEEDRELPGTYIWALARQYDADTFLLWFTDSRSQVFEAMVNDRRLPGTLVPDRAGKSGIVGDVRQRVILQRLDNAALDFIIEHRFELFALDEPWLLTRFRRLPRVPPDALPALKPRPAASSPAASAP